MSVDNDIKLQKGRVAVPTIFLFLFLSIGYIFLWEAYTERFLSTWMTVFIGACLAYGMFTILHEASHGNISGGNKRFVQLELLLGWLSGFTLLIPYSTFTAIHLEHHAHTNDPEQDPDHYVNGKNALVVFFRCLTMIIHYYKHALGKESRHNAAMKHTRWHTIIFLFFMVVFASILIGLGLGNQLFFVFLLPALTAAPFLAFSFDWLPHFPHHNMSKHLNTRIITIPGLEFLSFFQSYHLIHHLYPRVPFYKYKTKFQLIEPELVQKKSPIEGWRKDDQTLFDVRNTYDDIANGSTWHYALEVAHVEPLTHNAVAIQFKNVGELPFRYKAGQYVVISKMVNHEKVSRCYSICSNPNNGKLVIGVKRVSGGLLSNKLLDTVKVGQPLSVSGPFGNFGLKSNKKKHLFIAGGSGITPILSMIEKSLEDDQSSLQLIYGCRSAEDVMFKNRLEALAKNFPHRFQLMITYDLLVAKKQKELIGAIDEKVAVYICGPTLMMKASKEALAEIGVYEENIITEEFRIDSDTLSGQIHSICKEKQSFTAYESETILEASRRNKMTLPHACGMGQCGTCKVKLKSGEVAWKTEEQSVLLENEIKEGYILSCMCYAKSSIEIEN